MKLGGGILGGWETIGKEGEYDQNTLCIWCVKFSKNKFKIYILNDPLSK